MEKSYGNIIPIDYQDELIAIADSTKNNSFRVGDITNALIALNDMEPVDQIYNAVGLFAGKRSRTIREYSSVSRFYPNESRDKYSHLSFDHFRIAMRFGEKWEDALEWASDQTIEMNRPATVDAMELHFEGSKTNKNFGDEDVHSRLESVLNQLQEILVGSKLDQRVIQPLIELIQRIKTMSEKQPVA